MADDHPTADPLRELRTLRQQVQELERRLAARASGGTVRVEEDEAACGRRRSLLDNVNDAVLLLQDERIVACNDRACELFGELAQELLGTALVGRVAPAEQTLLRWAMQRVEAEERVRFDTVLVAAPDRRFHVEVTCRLLDPEGGLVQAVLRDRTERKRLDEQRQQRQQMEAVGTLAGGVAHEFNNVMAAIMGLASVLEEELPEGSPLQGDAQAILEAARRGASITRSLMSFARRAPKAAERLDLNKLVERVLRAVGRGAPAGVELQRDLGRPDAIVDGDPLQLEQVLTSLCLNGFDAIGEQGQVQVSTRCLDLDGDEARRVGLSEGGRYVALEVSDRGCGMDEATRRRAFEPFFTTKPVGKGSGLGLAHAYGVVRDHDGAISIESETGRGTTVRVLLPVLAERPAMAAWEPAAGADDEFDLAVLVVDDEPVMRRAAGRLLGRLGCRVLLAESGTEALRVVAEQAQAIDLVLLDLSMPGMDGIECYEALRRAGSSLPVLICTGRTDLDDAVARRLEGTRGVLAKPFDGYALSQALTAAMADRDRR